MDLKKNDIVDIDIVSMSAEGSGVGRHNNIAVFTPMSAVGDRVRVKILKVKKTYAYGKIEKILYPSPFRITCDCNVFEKCGGCVYRHISYSEECNIKFSRVNDAIKRIGGITEPNIKPIIPSENTEFYRNKAQLPIALSGEVGFFAVHSHRIVPIVDCKIQPEIFNKISSVFSEWIIEYNISVYDESIHKGLVRHLYLRVAEKTGEIMVVIIANGKTIAHIDKLIVLLKTVIGSEKFTLIQNINTLDTNVILGDECITLYGDGYITDILCGIKVRISALSFYQVNRTMAERLYEKAAEYAKPDGCTVLDLYCGTGTIGLSLADKAKTVIGAEVIPQAVNDAIFNAKLNGINNAQFICADAADAAKTLADKNIKPEAVIIDPPRKGCSEKLLDIIANNFCPERLVYVSCDPATLARDIKILDSLGYKLVEATPVDLFPRTAHVETVALLVPLKK